MVKIKGLSLGDVEEDRESNNSNIIDNKSKSSGNSNTGYLEFGGFGVNSLAKTHKNGMGKSGVEKPTNSWRDVEIEVKNFKNWLSQFNLSESSERIYTYVISKFLADGYDVWSNESVNRFLKRYNNPNYRAAIRWYLKFKKIKDYELIKPKPKRKKIKKVVELEELAKYVELLRDKDLDVYWVYKLALLTGARIHEILNLKLKDIDKEEGCIIFRKTKTGDERRVWIDKEELEELVSYLIDKKGILNEDRCFFTKWRNIKAVYVELRERVMKYLPKDIAKIFLRTHNFRRAVINHLLKITGGKIMVAKAFIGHKSIESTERYVAELTEEMMAKEAARLLFSRKSKPNSIG